MAVNSSQTRMNFDTAAAVTLRDVTDGAETSTASETAVSLAELDGAYWHAGEIPHGVFLIGVNVTAIDQTSDETYVVSIQVDDTLAMSDSPVTIASYTLTDLGTGTYVFAIDSKMIPVLDPDTSGTDKWVRITATLGGTTPSITYGAWIGRSVYAG